MKKLLLILASASAVFMVFAILQEWQTFTPAWLGAGEVQPKPLAESDRKAAADSVYLLLSLMQHFYTSDGDPRFADRMPAAAAVIEEMRADADYLRRNRRRQSPSLERLEIAAVEPLGSDRVEVRTREWWQVAILWIDGGAPAEPVRSQVIRGKYLVVRQDASWQVAGWDFVAPGSGEGGESGAGAGS